MNFNINLIIKDNYLIFEINKFNYDIKKIYLDNNELKIYEKIYIDGKVHLYVNIIYYYLINENSNLILHIVDKGCLTKINIKRINNLSDDSIKIKRIECLTNKIVFEIIANKNLQKIIKVGILDERYNNIFNISEIKSYNYKKNIFIYEFNIDEISLLCKEGYLSLFIYINDKEKFLLSENIYLNIDLVLKKEYIINYDLYNFYYKNGKFKYTVINGLLDDSTSCYYENNKINIRFKETLDIDVNEYKIVLIDEFDKMLYFNLQKENELIYAFLEVNSIEDFIKLDTKKISVWLYNIVTKNKIPIKNTYKKAYNTFFYSKIPIKYKDIYIRIEYNIDNELVICSNSNELRKDYDKGIFLQLPLKLKIKYVGVIIYSQMIYFLYLVLRNFKKYDNIWLIGEMDNTAQDNGFHLFKYIRENYPQLKCHYMINKDAPDCKNIELLGNIIYRKSFKHILYLFLAKYHIGTHDYRHWHYPGYENLFIKMFEKKMKGKYIQLQHGVIHVKSERGFHLDPMKYYDKIVVSGDYEKNILLDYFGYQENQIICTGLARYDNLVDLSKTFENKIITIMPTWRKGLNTREKFLNSLYYKTWSSIIKNKNLIYYLEKNNIKLQFYMHIKLQKYSTLFDMLENNNIKIIKHGEKNVQEILKESSLLITDYSSVSFDFAYMKKPVIFYQYDKLQYMRSYKVNDRYQYEENMFGKICSEENEVLEKIIFYIKNGFIMENNYLEKTDIHFKYRDFDNCERIFKAILDTN